MKPIDSILISNRGPNFTMGDVVHLSQGGTSDAYKELASKLCDMWICLVSEKMGEAPIVSNYANLLAPIFIENGLYDRYYHRFISEFLYPHLLGFPDKAISGENIADYTIVSELIINRLQQYLPNRLLLCDYHLFRIPSLIDWQCQKVFFWFLPFLEIGLHAPIHKEIVRGLLECELVFFYTDKYVENFLEAIQEYYPNRNNNCVPLSLISGPDKAFHDVEDISRSECNTLLHRYFDIHYPNECSYYLSVSRLDFVKNIPLIIKGFENFLSKKETSKSSPQLIVIAPHHRQESRIYQLEHELINNAIAQSPYQQHMSISHRRFTRKELKILYKYSDALIIGSRFDGLPLTALEYTLANKKNGAIVASKTAGCSDYLGEDVYQFNNESPEDLGRALLAASSSSTFDNRKKMQRMKSVVQEDTVEKWVAKVAQILESQQWDP